jgi:hypothetical protein
MGYSGRVDGSPDTTLINPKHFTSWLASAAENTG